MAWKVLLSGTMLDVAISEPSVLGNVQSMTRVYEADELIRGELTKPLIDRYRQGELYLRERVQYGEIRMIPATDDDGKEIEGADPVPDFVPKDLPEDSSSESEASGGSSDDDGNDNSEKVTQLQSRVDTLQDEIQSVTNERDSLQGERDNLKEELESTKSDLQEAEEAATGGLTYNDLSPEALAVEAEKKGVTPESGTGSNGNVIKADLVKALEEARSSS